mmetsp:Transcript_30810/g.47207  ORF Transcript_30810/g.47207 Transcript_30810/m.47207 type:complete len:154 (-) Transcript_30810:190-651(-)|eukprot:CAMPEP_0195302336 /NCGR_PEP_ID=MMETSP0707-20130614/30906_1 /TAXON_ID=33640 /ORGANISM="Asterionellopsis glacialis, Strain CCMP134" /LENGTH=153 /DNA_ID=CAMNT_0040365555 /DNA_START=32 /DNA_END=493 /DNA_ORIENTATION=-
MNSENTLTLSQPDQKLSIIPSYSPQLQVPLGAELERHEMELTDSLRYYGHTSAQVAKSLNALGLFYQYMMQDQMQALFYHEQAFQIQHQLCLEDDSIATLVDMASLHEMRGETQQALALNHQALILLETLDTVSKTDPRRFSIRRSMERMSRM